MKSRSLRVPLQLNELRASHPRGANVALPPCDGAAPPEGDPGLNFSLPACDGSFLATQRIAGTFQIREMKSRSLRVPLQLNELRASHPRGANVALPPCDGAAPPEGDPGLNFSLPACDGSFLCWRSMVSWLRCQPLLVALLPQ